MVFLSSRTRRAFFLAVVVASTLAFCDHALAASPEHVAPLAILSTENGKAVDLTNGILHEGAAIPIPTNETMALYIAATAPVSSLHFSGIDTFGAGGALDYAYQNGNAFAPLTVTEDSGANFTKIRADGTADITFVFPDSWSKTTLTEDTLQRSAYWIRVTARTPYTESPYVKKVDATVFTTQATFIQDSFGGYNGLVRATPTAGCGSDAAVLREAATANGIHWFVVRTTTPTCTLTVSPPGFLSTAFSARTFQGTPETLTTPITLQHRTVVTVLDEQGLQVRDATVSFDGLTPDAQQGGTYFFGNEDTTDARLIIRRSGYVTEDGHGQNSALYHVSGGTKYQQTSVTLTPNASPCKNPIAPGILSYCAIMTPNVTVYTLDGRHATSSASVTIYTDSSRTTIADDQSRVGDNDAGFVSDQAGTMRFSLRVGTYYYTATALGAPATKGSFYVLPDVPTTVKIDYWPATPHSTTPSASASKITILFPSPLYAKGDSVTVIVSARDSLDYPLPNSTVKLSVSSTPLITPTTAKANDVGEWYYLFNATESGSTKIVATIDGIALNDVPTLTFLAPPPLQDSRISATKSVVTISATTAPADNTTTRTVTVTARNSGSIAVVGKTVTLTTSCPGITMQPTDATTNSAGQTSFIVKGSIEGNCQFAATADRIPLAQTVSLTFGSFHTCPIIAAGSLVKLPDDHDASTEADTAVYYIGIDCKRHAFPNARVYESWYSSFGNIATVSATQLASIPLGKNVTYKPGVRLVKFLSLSKVYAVAADGKLRWVPSEAIAQTGYGATWNTNVDDISDAFYGDYLFGDDLTTTGDITAELQQSTGATIDSVL
jgi:hypothetical protein